MYNYYQQPSTTAMAATAAAVSTAQSGLSWNGSAWVSSSALGAAAPHHVQSSSYSTYQSSTAAVGGINSSYTTTTTNNNNSNSNHHVTKNTTTSTIPENPVLTYTNYYHEWTKHAKEQEEYCNKLPMHNTAERTEAQRRVDWAKYYADQSSRAAHFFHQNPNATSAPFDLPPSPTASNDNNDNNTSTSAATTNQQQQQQQHHNASDTHNNGNRQQGNHYTNNQNMMVSNKNNNNNNEIDESSFKRFFRRCLEQAKNQQEKDLIKKELETVASKAFQEDRMYTTNWDDYPLVRLPNQNRADTNRNHKNSKVWKPKTSAHQDNRNVSLAASKYGKDYDNKLPTNDSYYGMSATNSSTNNSSKMENFPPSQGPNNRPNRRSSNQSDASSRSGPAATSPRRGSNLSSTSSFSSSSFDNKNNNNNNNNSSANSYYGPSSNRAQKSNFSSTLSSQSINNDASYYGPASSSVFSSSLSSPGNETSTNSQQQRKNKRTRSPEQEEEFIPLFASTHNNKKNKSNKKHSKGSSAAGNDGFEVSSDTLAKRANRFSGRGGIADATKNTLVDSSSAADKYMGKRLIGGSHKKLDEHDFEQMTVKGTCQTLEKEYLRLTAPPRAELVRPQYIMERHLENLKAERRNNKGNRRDYIWFCSQFKALRQDCTVQRIQNEFTVDVYETHAKVALEEGDLNEYNQCQTQLKELYEKLTPNGEMSSSSSSSLEAVKNANEFIAYRLLYYVFLTGNEKYDGGSSDLFKIMLSLTPDQRQNDPAIRHALALREAVALGDYFKFFALHKFCPNHGKYITERMVPTIRLRALRRMAKAYRPMLDLEFCLKQLGFSNNNKEEGKKWLISCGCVLDGNNFITKDSTIHEPEVDPESKNSLI